MQISVETIDVSKNGNEPSNASMVTTPVATEYSFWVCPAILCIECSWWRGEKEKKSILPLDLEMAGFMRQQPKESATGTHDRIQSHNDEYWNSL